VLFDARARAWDSPDLARTAQFSRKVRTLSAIINCAVGPVAVEPREPDSLRVCQPQLLRLAVPFALAAVLVASIFLSGPIYRSALALQILFYGLSLLADCAAVAAVGAYVRCSADLRPA